MTKQEVVEKVLHETKLRGLSVSTQKGYPHRVQEFQDYCKRQINRRSRQRQRKALQ